MSVFAILVAGTESAFSWAHDIIAGVVAFMFGWLISVENRLSTGKQQGEGLKELMNTKFEDLDKLLTSSFTNLDKRMERVEDNLDAVKRNGK